jgi:hypothetical protein
MCRNYETPARWTETWSQFPSAEGPPSCDLASSDDETSLRLSGVADAGRYAGKVAPTCSEHPEV